MATIKICNNCRQKYYALSGAQKFCISCRELTCQHCGKRFLPDQIKIQRFCDKSCYAKFQTTLRHEKTNAWKESISISGVHVWLNRDYGKPKFCEACGTESEDRIYDWANISGEYLRDREDFLRLCRNCHRRFDMTPKKKTQAIKNLIWYQ